MELLLRNVILSLGFTADLMKSGDIAPLPKSNGDIVPMVITYISNCVIVPLVKINGDSSTGKN